MLILDTWFISLLLKENQAAMKTVSNCLLVILLLFVLQKISAQQSQRIDSLERLYKNLPNDTTKVLLIDDLFKYYYYNDINTAKEYAIEQERLSKKIKYKKGIGESYNKHAACFMYFNKIDSAEIYSQKALAIFQDINYAKGESKIRYNMSTDIAYKEDGLNKSLEAHTSNIPFYEKIKDSFILGKTYSAIGRIQMVKGNYQIALKESLKAIKILEAIENELETADVYKVMSAIECELGNGEQALSYGYRALDVFKKANDQLSIARTLNTIGITYDTMDQFVKADSIYEEALSLSKKINNPYNQKLVLINHSRSFEKRNDYENAIIKLKAYLELDKNSQDKINSSLGLIGMGTSESLFKSSFRTCKTGKSKVQTISYLFK